MTGGQTDKHMPLGANPNAMGETDEYILNLQQQVHFMELEMKILKEKVMEDEKNSGIGSLYDDERNSYAHIQELRRKYAEMKNNFERQTANLNNRKLEVSGQGFELKSKVKAMRENNAEVGRQVKEFDGDFQKRHFTLDKEVSQAQKTRAELESEMRSLQNQLDKSSQEHYDNWLYLEKEARFEEERRRRHAKEMDLKTTLTDTKTKELDAKTKEMDALTRTYQAMEPLQTILKECDVLRKKIEEALVASEMNSTKVKMMEESVAFLNDKRDYLTDEKNEAERRNEELRTQVKAQQEVAAKRLQQKLVRDKSEQTKQLIAEEELLTQQNEDISNKLREEREKYDALLAQRMEIDEQVRLKQLKLTDDTAKVADQDKSLADLRAQIDAEQAKLEETNQGLDAARKLHRREEENQRELSLKNAALNEKLAFIQAHYDYKSQVKKMDLDKFSKLTSSNMQVRGRTRF